MKYFVFSDVHGFYDLLIGKLNSEGFDINNPNHMLISLGDNFDRGPQNYLVYSFLFLFFSIYFSITFRKMNRFTLVH